MGVHKSPKDKEEDLGYKPKSDPLSWIPEGEYDAVCIKVEKSRYLGSEKRLYVHFQIVDGEYQETQLFETFNINYQSFPRRSKYYTDWSIANGGLPKRRDRMSPKIFLKKVFRVKVRDVKPLYEDGKAKPEMFKYSVVDRIVEKVTG